MALPALVPGHVLGLDGAAPASETVRVGVIGCGGRSPADRRGGRREAVSRRGLLRLSSSPRAEAYAKELSHGAKWGVYQDFRKMIAKGEARRRDGRNHDPRPGLDRDPGHAGRFGHLHREADVPDHRRGPDHGQGRAEVQPRDPGRHPAALDADQQLGQRPGQERRPGQDHDRARPELRRARTGGPDARPRTSRARSSTWWDMWTNQAELRPYDVRDPSRLGPLVGLRRRRAVLRRDRLGHPLLRPDQPRPGHGRHRARSRCCWKSRSRFATRASSSAGRPSAGSSSATRATSTPAPTTTAWPSSAGLRAQGDHEVRQRHGTEAPPGRRPRPGPGGDLHRREGEDRDQPRQDRQQPEEHRPLARTTPATTSGPKRPTTSRTGSSASRAASPATPTSRSACGPRRSATW